FGLAGGGGETCVAQAAPPPLGIALGALEDLDLVIGFGGVPSFHVPVGNQASRPAAARLRAGHQVARQHGSISERRKDKTKGTNKSNMGKEGPQEKSAKKSDGIHLTTVTPAGVRPNGSRDREMQRQMMVLVVVAGLAVGAALLAWHFFLRPNDGGNRQDPAQDKKIEGQNKADPAREKKFAAVRRLGGQVEVDEDNSDKPFLRVNFIGTACTDKDLQVLTDFPRLQGLWL